MNIYLHELAPWEAEQQYLEVKSLSRSTREISSQLATISKKNRIEQIKTADAVIASQEKIEETIEKGFSEVSDKIEQFNQAVNYSIYELKSSFEWGITEILWNIEQTNNYLHEILNVLKTPMATQAQEYKERGLLAFKNKWFDDSLAEFNKAQEINKYDFTIYFTVGLIYHFHFIDKNKAIINYKLALKYAEPNSNYYYSNILLHLALACSSIGNFSDAEKYTSEAIDAVEDFAEALYQNAQYNALLGNFSKTLYNLEKAISLDHDYIIKANKDSIFKTNKLDLHTLNKKLKDREKTNAQNILEKYKNDYNHLVGFVNKVSVLNIWGETLSNVISASKVFIDEYELMIQKFQRDSFYDYIDIVKNVEKANKLLNDIKQKSSWLLTKQSYNKSPYPYQDHPIDIISYVYLTEKLKREKEIQKIYGRNHFTYTISNLGVSGLIFSLLAIAFFSFIIKLVLWIWVPWDSHTFVISFIVLSFLFVLLIIHDTDRKAKYKNQELLKIAPLKKEFDNLQLLLKDLSRV